jgi:hypothetical protein
MQGPVSFQRKPYVRNQERKCSLPLWMGTTGWRVASAAVTGSTKEERHHPAREIGASSRSPVTRLWMLQYTYYVLSSRGI